jgi:uncharacterized protein (TIRG00374 family)
MKRWISWIIIPPALLLCLPLIRNIPGGALADWASGFGAVSLIVLLLFETASWFMMGERWRFFCREHGARIGLNRSTAARLSGFAWSYITPGPHFGGEPVQILYLARRGHPVQSTLPALMRDRGYEFFAGLLTVTLIVLLPGNVFDQKYYSLIPAAALLLGALLLASNRKAYRAFVGLIMKLSGQNPSRRRQVHRYFAMLFRNSARKERSMPVRILLLLSLLQTPLLVIMEIKLFFILSGTPLAWYEAMALAGVSRATHYAPVPGAVGVYDAGMLGSGAWMGLDPGTSAAYVMVTRLRDLVQVVIGLLLASLPTGVTNEY